jgi:membrane-associated phospholipid phosphatase
MSRHSRAALLAALTLAACAEPASLPTTPPSGAPDASRVTPATDRETASARWSALTRAIAARRGASPPVGARLFALTNVAAYDAVIAAEDAKSRGAHPSVAAAAASAVATVLAGIYPAEATVIESQLIADASYFLAVPSERDAVWSLGVPIGRTVGLAVLARAAADGSTTPWTGTPPAEENVWTPSPGTQALLPQWGSVRAWFLTSNDQFRPLPPPVFGSLDFRTAIAEVRAISDARTAEQMRIATYWQTGAGGGAARFLNATAIDLVERHHLDERSASRALALMHIAVMDASIGCWEAKFHYFTIRPFQADNAITTPVGFPQHPSYPSAHSCLTSSAFGVLMALFPSDADELRAMVEEAGEARIYAGLHYRFDVIAGRKLGYGVAAFVLASAPGSHEPIPLD